LRPGRNLWPRPRREGPSATFNCYLSERLANEIDSQLGKQIDEKLGDKVPEEIKDALKKPEYLLKGLSGLLGGKKEEEK